MGEEVTIAVERPECQDVAALLLEGRALMRSLYPPESCHGLDLDGLAGPEVTLCVARVGGRAAGCCAWVLPDDGSGELKSLYVPPWARRRGIARALLERIEAQARARVSWLRLETGVLQEDAIRLYEALGYRRRGPFGDFRPDPLSVFMEKPLQVTGVADKI